MRVLRDADAFDPPNRGTAVTIGAYDGVHAGHRAIIAEVQAVAAARELATAVVTFDRHPAMVVRPESAPKLLTDLDQRLELLAATGIDLTVVVHFDEHRAHEAAEDFVTRVLVGKLNARAVIVGEDFHFGHGRSGNVALLRRMGAIHGFEVLGLPLVAAGPQGEPVSSTAIRRLLAAGEVAAAEPLLGRPYEVRGVVREGDKRGGPLLGFPTANVAVPGDILLPADGIYAGWFVRADGTVHPTAINLGRRPQFYETAHASLLEAHVLDFDGDLYGEHVAVRFVARLRAEARFDSVDALIAQIGQDCDDARAVLGIAR
jgi:riboflavin kinase/FMN adenylyltransferase